ncbi:MAG: UDP-N-acetylmuramate dehydrogenase [bacterium]|nr:UDP-N-acetylmuramate dehydrogenase [bacterium]
MELLKNVSIAEFTSFKIGGKADYFCRARSVDELKEALAFARRHSLPIFILGGGTNMLLSDDGFRGVVVKIELHGVKWGEASVVAAGENWDSFVAETVARGLWGLENLSGIPGTVGAAPVQNIGAYGVEIAEVLEWVEALDMRTGEIKQLSNADCAFAYRDSIFKKQEGKNFIITRVAFRLQKDGAPNLQYKDLAEYFSSGGAPTLQQIRRAVLEIRARKFPDLKTHGTAGSFFKNPIISKEKFEELKKRFPGLSGFPVPSGVKVPLAWILDKICGLKGFEQDNTALWKDQPLVLVNKGGASASAVSALADNIAHIVKEKTGIEIEREVNFLC